MLMQLLSHLPTTNVEESDALFPSEHVISPSLYVALNYSENLRSDFNKIQFKVEKSPHNNSVLTC